MPQAFVQTATISDQLNALRHLRAQDAYVEEQMAITGKNAIWWWVGFGASVILLFVTVGAVPALGGFFGLAALVCLGFGIFWSVKKAGWAKQDIENRRIDLTERFLEMLGKDIPAKARCNVNVSFAPYQQHGKVVSEMRGNWLNPISMFKYADTWFTARGRLVDGNRFRVTIEQIINRKEKRKRKYTKINERIREEVSLLLRLSPESYPNWSLLQQSLVPGTVGNLTITGVQVAGGQVRVTGVTAPSTRLKGRGGVQAFGEDQLASGDTLLQLFVYVYAQLQNCRAEAGGAVA